MALRARRQCHTTGPVEPRLGVAVPMEAERLVDPFATCVACARRRRIPRSKVTPFFGLEHAMTITGRCLCGAIRWESAQPPIVTRVCWCRECQYIGAGSGTVNACFRTAAFTVTGKTKDYRSVADSGNQMHRRFCPSCGTPLFSEAEARPHLIFVRVGTFDDPNLAEPAMTIWTSSAPRWAKIDAASTQVEKQPPPAA
jgi:hypothetical protein